MLFYSWCPWPAQVQIPDETKAMCAWVHSQINGVPTPEANGGPRLVMALAIIGSKNHAPWQDGNGALPCKETTRCDWRMVWLSYGSYNYEKHM